MPLAQAASPHRGGPRISERLASIATFVGLLGVGGCTCGETHVATDASTLDAAIDAVSVDAHVADDAPGPLLSLDERHDFDGDGHADLVIGDPTYRAGRGAVWLVRASEGGPLPPMLVAEGEPDEHLGSFVFPVSDQDGDGRHEIGTYQPAGDEAWSGRWLGTRGGSGALPSLSGWWSVVDVASVDLDRDPAPDLYVTYRRGPPREPQYGGLLVTHETVEEELGWGSWEPLSVAIDVPGSSRRGLVSRTADGVVLRSEGVTRTLYEREGVAAVRPVGDVDGDDQLDLLVRLGTGPIPSALLLLRAEGVSAIEPPACSIGLGDWDCDGFDDLALGHSCAWYWTSDTSPTEWLAGGTDGPSMPAPLPAGVARALTHPDLDLDGCRDEPSRWSGLDPAPPATIARGRARAPSSESWPLGLPPTVVRAQTFLAIDGEVWARSPYLAPPAFRHDGTRVVGVDAIPPEYPVPFTFGDVDGDGLDDAIGSYEIDSEPSVLFWRGRGGGFEPTDLVVPVVSMFTEFLQIVGDVDGDGDSEVIASLLDGGRLLRGGAAFPDEGVLVTLSAPERLSIIHSVGDVDGDGRVDLGGVSNIGMARYLWLARDMVAGTAEPVAVYTGSYDVVPSGDVDGDGLDDLVTLGTGHLSVYLGRRGLPPEPEPWRIELSDSGQVGPDGLILALERSGTTLLVRRITRTGLVDHTTITAPLSVAEAYFQGRFLILPRAEAEAVHVYRVEAGRLEGPIVFSLPPGDPSRRPFSSSPSFWTP